MRISLANYYKQSSRNFGEAVINLFIFLPYFFSVGTLIKTIFFPWRNLQSKNKTVGFSFSDWGNKFFFNFISRGIGAAMRMSIIIFYFIFQTVLMIGLPFAAMFYFLLIPLFYFFQFFKKTPDAEKNSLKDFFISTHMLKIENKPQVEKWFENYFQNHLEKKQWWKLANLFSLPPLARDWAAGYTPNLDQYTQDLASSKYLQHINNIVDREKEIEEIERNLTKNSEANVVVVGDEGVGKHTIIDVLAKKIYLGKTNIHLMYRRILKLNMEKIKDNKNLFEELLEEATDSGNIILFIDNFEKYLQLGDSLEKFAKSDRLQLIGMTTPFFYQKFILPDEKINRLFTKIDVFEVTKKDAHNILLEKFTEFEKYHQVIIPYETILEAIDKSEYYLTYIPFPEKAVDLLDAACVYVKQKTLKTKQPLKLSTVMPEDIDAILTDKTHIPTVISNQMKEKLLHLESLLSAQIFDQNEAIVKLSSALRRSFLLIGKRKKPLGAFLFLGPTGVGKTATAKTVASVFFSSNPKNNNLPGSLIRFDMSNYQTKYDIPKLIGDINSNQPGLLSTSIREKPYGVLLLDEIEKADKDLINIFLTVIDEGYFTDGFGRFVDCKNLVIIATSNAKNIEVFSPEFINRFDGVVTFNQLTHKTLGLIARKILLDLAKDVYNLHKVKLEIKEETINSLIGKGYDPKYGARNMERIIRDEIEDKVAKLILEDRVKSGNTVTL